MTQQSTIAAK